MKRLLIVFLKAFLQRNIWVIQSLIFKDLGSVLFVKAIPIAAFILQSYQVYLMAQVR